MKLIMKSSNPKLKYFLINSIMINKKYNIVEKVVITILNHLLKKKNKLNENYMRSQNKINNNKKFKNV